MPTIRVPSALRKLTGGASDVEVGGATVRAALDDLNARHPGILAKLLDGGVVKPFIRIFVGDEDIADGGLDTPVGGKDEISIVPAIAGGSGACGGA